MRVDPKMNCAHQDAELWLQMRSNHLNLSHCVATHPMAINQLPLAPFIFPRRNKNVLRPHNNALPRDKSSLAGRAEKLANWNFPCLRWAPRGKWHFLPWILVQKAWRLVVCRRLCCNQIASLVSHMATKKARKWHNLKHGGGLRVKITRRASIAARCLVLLIPRKKLSC